MVRVMLSPSLSFVHTPEHSKAINDQLPQQGTNAEKEAPQPVFGSQRFGVESKTSELNDGKLGGEV